MLFLHKIEKNSHIWRDHVLILHFNEKQPARLLHKLLIKTVPGLSSPVRVWGARLPLCGAGGIRNHVQLGQCSNSIPVSPVSIIPPYPDHTYP